MLHKFKITFILLFFLVFNTTNVMAIPNFQAVSKDSKQNLMASEYDISKLEVLIDLVEKVDLHNYTQESVSLLLNTLSRAKEVLLSPPSQADIDLAELELSKAFKYLELSYLKQLDSLVKVLDDLVDLVDSHKLAIFTNESYQWLKGELVGAKLFLNEQPENELGAKKMVASLNDYLSNLTYLFDQQDSLSTLSSEVSNLLTQSAEVKDYLYQRDGILLLNQAQDMAEVSLNITDNSLINKHYLYVSKHALTQALAKLEKIEGSKEQLVTLVDEVKKIDLDQYEKEDKKPLLEDLEKAQQLLIDDNEEKDDKSDNLTKEYKALLEDLSSKKAKLKLIEEDKGLDNDKTSNSKIIFDNVKPNVGTNAKSGLKTETYFVISIIVGILIMLSLVGYMRYLHKDDTNV